MLVAISSILQRKRLLLVAEEVSRCKKKLNKRYAGLRCVALAGCAPEKSLPNTTGILTTECGVLKGCLNASRSFSSKT